LSRLYTNTCLELIIIIFSTFEFCWSCGLIVAGIGRKKILKFWGVVDPDCPRLRLRPEIAWSAGIVGRSFAQSCFAPLRLSCRPHTSASERPVAPSHHRLQVAILSVAGIRGYPRTVHQGSTMMDKKMDASRAVKLKDEGNALFRKGDFREAPGKYSQGTHSTPPPKFLTLQLIMCIAVRHRNGCDLLL